MIGSALLKLRRKFTIRVAERFFSGVPQPPPPWRLLPEPFLLYRMHPPRKLSQKAARIGKFYQFWLPEAIKPLQLRSINTMQNNRSNKDTQRENQIRS